MNNFSLVNYMKKIIKKYDISLNCFFKLKILNSYFKI